ncbi:hypothetical protein K2173_016434 [Erythroxylum novogranatense]|uniref:PH domain-containing protein n=1 Tax=Erythroxylum novogranatense TaxID=1862640 RepID=A0AAV8SGR3_9ROSI|nr:hypothetical protein K2173_016434 [Erythroxylum novogranatense]
MYKAQHSGAQKQISEIVNKGELPLMGAHPSAHAALEYWVCIAGYSATLGMRSCSSLMNITPKLEIIDENGPATEFCRPPETPTESMEFLCRSWSVSAKELSRALCSTRSNNNSKETVSSSSEAESAISASDESELLLLHQALNSVFGSSQQLLKDGLYKSMLKGRTIGRWMKDHKQMKKQEVRAHNAQLHAAISVAGVASAVASQSASNAMSMKMAATNKNTHKISAAMASAAALVASHCIEIAEDMGATHRQISAVVNSAISARTSGDIITLTAGAATALRGAATFTAGLPKGYGTIVFTQRKDKGGIRELKVSVALSFVTRGGELLKRTRKGALHWKRVSFNINSNWQVVVKMKSKHMAGTLTNKKCVVSEVYDDIQEWAGRWREESGKQRAYFGIKTAERIIEFECRSRDDKQIWIEGIQYMLNSVLT